MIPVEVIEKKILLIRGQKVILDRDLAELYGVEVKQLKRQVKRNIDRFPTDFMFQLSKEEHESLRRQFGTLKRGKEDRIWKGIGVINLKKILISKTSLEYEIKSRKIGICP